MASFESVAEEYDAARPAHPPGVYDALGDLDGLVTLDVGAGTGIASRALLERGAQVVAVDRGVRVLTRAVARTPSLPAIVADGVALPVPDAAADLICFAESWHWLDPATRVPEVFRVLRDRGRWAAWWSHPRADGEAWFEAHWSLVESVCGAQRGHRDVDWGATVADLDGFDVGERIVVPWTRDVTVDTWITELTSHSYVIGLDPPSREELLRDLRHVADHGFPDGRMQIPYDTWLWIATKV